MSLPVNVVLLLSRNLGRFRGCLGGGGGGVEVRALSSVLNGLGGFMD